MSKSVLCHTYSYMANNISSNPNNVLNTEYNLLPSNRRYRVPKFRKVRLKHSVVHQSILELNQVLNPRPNALWWALNVVICCCNVVMNVCIFILIVGPVMMSCFWCPGPRFPKALLAYVVREVHCTIIVKFSDRFPKASLVTTVVKTLVANDCSNGTRPPLSSRTHHREVREAYRRWSDVMQLFPRHDLS